MTLIEISQRMASDKDAGVTSSAILMFGYHARWALSCATIFLALFALSLLKQRHVERWAVGVAASGAYVSYYFILFDGRVAALDGTLPAFAAAWMPNVVFAVASIALFILSAARSSPRSSA